MSTNGRSTELETVLTTTNLSFPHRLRQALSIELSLVLRLAAPAVLFLPHTTMSTDGRSAGLETILTATNLSFPRRLRQALSIELSLILRLAAPAVLVYMINFSMIMSTQIFCGRLGNLELVAASIGGNVVHEFSFSIMLGMASTVENLCGQAFGAGKNVDV